MLGLNEKTTGHIVKPDGTIATVPTTLIGADAAAIMRAYFSWVISALQLEPELFCGGCFNGSRDDKAQYDINESQIAIVCRCAQRVHFGASLPPNPVSASTTLPSNDTGVGHIVLSADAARLLRLYKKVLIELNLKEALRCNACYGLNQEDGCEAQVLTNSIRIRCRCSDRRYAGMTL